MMKLRVELFAYMKYGASKYFTQQSVDVSKNNSLLSRDFMKIKYNYNWILLHFQIYAIYELFNEFGKVLLIRSGHKKMLSLHIIEFEDAQVAIELLRKRQLIYDGIIFNVKSVHKIEGIDIVELQSTST